MILHCQVGSGLQIGWISCLAVCELLFHFVVNFFTVFAILLKYQETKDWEIALPIGVPKRRGFAPQSEP